MKIHGSAYHQGISVSNSMLLSVSVTKLAYTKIKIQKEKEREDKEKLKGGGRFITRILIWGIFPNAKPRICSQKRLELRTVKTSGTQEINFVFLPTLYFCGSASLSLSPVHPPPILTSLSHGSTWLSLSQASIRWIHTIHLVPSDKSLQDGGRCHMIQHGNNS